MFVVWLILFCCMFALAVMSVIDKEGWTEGARITGICFFSAATVGCGIMLARTW